MRALRTLVAGHDLKFFKPLQQALEETGRFEFRQDTWAGHDVHDEERSRDLLDWAEIIICEWCLGNAVWYTRNKRPEQHLVIRFHLQERTTPSPGLLSLEAVHTIAFVGRHIEREARASFGLPPEKTCTIPNLVDVARFAQPKYDGSFFNLGMLGTAPARKRMDLALDVLEELTRRDDRWCLHIKGAHPASYGWLWARTKERVYYEQQYERINAAPWRNRVVFDPAGDDVPEWLRCIGFVLSPSDFESFHMAVAEGMAGQALPVIWDWEGAREIYGPRFVVGSVTEATERIEALRRDTGLDRTRREALEYVRQHFDRSVVRDAWLRILLPGDSATRVTVSPPGTAERPLIVCHAIDNWPTFHRREMIQALADHLRPVADVLVVEPGGHWATLLKRGWADEDELSACLAGRVRRESDNLWRFRSLTGGFPAWVRRPPDLAAGLSDAELLRARIGQLFPGSRPRLHWIFKPDQRRRWLRPDDLFVYECYDDYTRDFATGSPLAGVAEEESGVLAAAQAAFFTSRVLLQAKGKQARKAVLAENGANAAAFAACRRPDARFPPPIHVGYLGNLAGFFDWQAMGQVAEAMPDVRFHFHGPIEKAAPGVAEGVARLRALANCEFSGRIDRQAGAQRITAYHALLIPFVRNPAMDAVNPLKLWEYFAAGRPVVSTPLRAIEPWADVVYFATEPQEWIEGIRAAAAEDDPTRRERRIQLAEAHSWQAMTAIHAEVLGAIISCQRRATVAGE